MSTQRTTIDKFWLILKGITMGAANKVPGVSGGLVAFVAGFYEEFIYSLQKINSKAFKLLLRGRVKSFIQYTNAGFLGLLYLAWLLAISVYQKYLITYSLSMSCKFGVLFLG